jgi:hypothetical protein
MFRWLTIGAFTGLMLVGCFQGPAQDTAPSSDRSSPSQSPPAMSATEAGAGSAATTSFDDRGGPVDLDAIVLTAPAGWQRIQPSSSFVAAEFTLPADEGGEADGRLTVSAAGGSVEANVDRWKGQFDPLADEKPLETTEVNGMSVTLVDFAGDFNDARGPFAPAVKRPGYRMIAAIVPVDGQLHFIKATGPQKTIAAHADAIHEFIRSVRRK